MIAPTQPTVTMPAVPTLSSLPSGNGVLPNQWLAVAIGEGVVDAAAFTIPAANIQPASVDLRLGEVGSRMRCSFLPDR